MYYVVSVDISQLGSVCSSSQLSVIGLPSNSSVTSWSSSNVSALTVSSTGVATRQGSFSGQVNVLAGGNFGNSSCTFSSTKPIFVGLPSASNSTLIYPSGQRGVDPVTLCTGCTYNFGIDFVPAAPSYTWVLPSGFSFVSGRNTSNPGIRVSTTPGSYTLYCSVNNSCGSSWAHSLVMNIGSGGGQQQRIMVYPNPATNSLTIESTGSNLTITDTNIAEAPQEGKSNRFSVKLISGENLELLVGESIDGRIVLDVSEIQNGLYFLHIKIGQEDLITRQILISK
jgi:hypothetical protein